MQMKYTSKHKYNCKMLLSILIRHEKIKTTAENLCIKQ